MTAGETVLIVYALLSSAVWYVTGELGQPTWVRVTLTLASPAVLIGALARRATMGRW